MITFIIEDNDSKYEDIKNTLLKYLPDTQILRDKTRNRALLTLHDYYRSGKNIDLVITDNYIPIYESEYLPVPCASFILTRLRHYFPSAYVCVCSSEKVEEDIRYNYFINYDSSVLQDENIINMIEDIKANKPKVLRKEK